MPHERVSRATRLVDRLADDLRQKREWAKEKQEPPFLMRRVERRQLLRDFDRAPEAERRSLLEKNGTRSILDALRAKVNLPGLED